MRVLLFVMAWLFLLALSWPMALDFVLIASLLWVVTLPLRLAWRALDFRR